ncbi:MAG: hypothetical protein LBK41_03690 [Clostridiales bacterium]|jgi:flagellar biosynthesis protein FlhF|nr:hypothetical protein [Clostridiales bacterium]
MRIRKFEGYDEKQIYRDIRDELGPDAVILSTKKAKPAGLFATLRKQKVEVTAAYEERLAEAAAPPPPDSERRIEHLNRELNEARAELDRALRYADSLRGGYRDAVISKFYDTLTARGVSPGAARELLDELDAASDTGELSIPFVMKVVMSKIVQTIGPPAPVETYAAKTGEPLVVMFVGSTGVGKTTTIAKLTADFILNKGLRVGLITADTYRIAAVDQLKTYADILGIEVGVAYTAAELSELIETMKPGRDIILVDTAGRPHKNRANMAELKAMAAAAPGALTLLVLSLATQREDMESITRAYGEICDYRLVFTKADETERLGSILDICRATGKRVAYITNGQSVPDDIKVISPDAAAKSLLGLGEV